MVSPEKVRKFLLEFKQVATSGSGIDIVPRRETRPTLLELGLTKANLEEIVLGLSVADYCKGPDADRDRPGEIWVFGRKIKEREVYIKIKVAQVEGKHIAKCLSFHFAQHPMKFPLR